MLDKTLIWMLLRSIAIQTLYDYHVKVPCCYSDQGDRSYLFTSSKIDNSFKDNEERQHAIEIMLFTFNRNFDYILMFQ